MTSHAPAAGSAPRQTSGATALAWNEARALLPVLAVGVLATTVAALTSGNAIGGLSFPAFRPVRALTWVATLGAMLALGAQAFGHEYAHRTLSLMLMLPMPRRQLFLIKLGVLSAMVMPLVGYISLVGIFRAQPVLPWVGAGAALCLAPLLTILCRSTLAGAVFGASVPGIVLILLTSIISAYDPAVDAERAARDAWAWLMIPLYAGAGVLGWRMFARLESIDGSAQDLDLPWWTAATRNRQPSRPLWQVLKKELCLQRMTFALTVLFVASAAIATLLHDWLDGDRSTAVALRAASAVYWLCLPALIGSLATAEERQLGTLAWQLQLPMPAWQQWAAKVGTAFGLALLLSIGVPLLLAQVLWSVDLPNLWVAGVLTMITTAGSLYISSVSTASMRAALASLAAIPLGLWLVVSAAILLRGAPHAWAPAFWNGRELGWVALLVLIVGLLVGLAFVNHRPEPPAASRVRRQALSLAAAVAGGLLALEVTSF